MVPQAEQVFVDGKKRGATTHSDPYHWVLSSRIRRNSDHPESAMLRAKAWLRSMPPGPPVLFALLNPSTADALRDDPTIRRCMAFARRWRFGALEVVNLFAFRSTDPLGLRKVQDPVGPDNDAQLRAAARRSTRMVAGWGPRPDQPAPARPPRRCSWTARAPSSASAARPPGRRATRGTCPPPSSWSHGSRQHPEEPSPRHAADAPASTPSAPAQRPGDVSQALGPRGPDDHDSLAFDVADVAAPELDLEGHRGRFQGTGRRRADRGRLMAHHGPRVGRASPHTRPSGSRAGPCRSMVGEAGPAAGVPRQPGVAGQSAQHRGVQAAAGLELVCGLGVEGAVGQALPDRGPPALRPGDLGLQRAGLAATLGLGARTGGCRSPNPEHADH